MNRFGRNYPFVVIAGSMAFTIAVLPVFAANEYVLRFYTLMMIYVLIAVGLNVLVVCRACIVGSSWVVRNRGICWRNTNYSTRLRFRYVLSNRVGPGRIVRRASRISHCARSWCLPGGRDNCVRHHS